MRSYIIIFRTSYSQNRIVSQPSSIKRKTVVRMKKNFNWLVLIPIILWSQTLSAQTDPTNRRLEDTLGRLYINHKSLTVVYSKLHDTALEAVNGSDKQLNYIQKSYLFVSEANMVCFYQWELLSIIDYIKDSHRSDYFTLRVKDLKRAIFETRDRVVSLKLYSAYIDDREALKLIDEAVGLIEANIYMFEELVAILKPLVNTPRPFDSSPQDS